MAGGNRTFLNCTNDTKLFHKCHYDQHVGYHIPREVVLCLLFSITLVSVVGNGLVVVIMFKIQRMQSFMNWLLFNLAVSDLSSAICCIVVDVTYEVYNRWVFGKTLCKILYPLRSITIFASIFTLIALSTTRYYAIHRPFARQPSTRFAKVLICAIWFASIMLAIPYVVVLFYDDNRSLCYELWSHTQSQMYTALTFIITYLVPLVLITYSYVSIVKEMTSKKGKRISNSLPVPRVILQENRNLVLITLIITVTFGVCILPYHVVWLLYDFAGLANHDYFYDLIDVSYLLLYLNSALNPIIYNIFSVSFRGAFAELCKSCVGCCACTKQCDDMEAHRTRPSRRVTYRVNREPSQIEIMGKSAVNDVIIPLRNCAERND